jgi:hypothetical protein
MSKNNARAIHNRRLVKLIASLAMAILSSAQAISLDDANEKSGYGTRVYQDPSTLERQICTYIYPADVDQRTYNIVVPGRYCLASDLVARLPAEASPTSLLPDSTNLNRDPPSFSDPKTPAHTGPAINIHVSDVEIDFGGYTLSEYRKESIEYGIHMEYGLGNIHIHGGAIAGFEIGISNGPTGLTSYAPNTAISIRKMQFNGSFAGPGTHDVGVSLGGISDSVISQNEFDGHWMALGIAGADDVIVSLNRFDLPSTNSTNSWSIGLYTQSRVRNVLIADNTFYGHGYTNRTGIFLHNNTRHVTVSQLGRDNIIERNILYGVQDPINIGGTGIGSNNVVRHNQIYGDYPYNFTRTYPSGFPHEFAAIKVSNNIDIEIVGNYIFSALGLPYYNGIKLESGTTVKPDSNGNPLLRYNQTCGVFDPLVPPPGVAESSVDGGNYWNVFCMPPVIP